MANDQEWQRRSDEWVAATNQSRLQKEARLQENEASANRNYFLTRVKAASANILGLVTDSKSRITGKRQDHEQR